MTNKARGVTNKASAYPIRRRGANLRASRSHLAARGAISEGRGRRWRGTAKEGKREEKVREGKRRRGDSISLMEGGRRFGEIQSRSAYLARIWFDLAAEIRGTWKVMEGVRRRVYLAHIWFDLAAEIGHASCEEARRRRVGRVALCRRFWKVGDCMRY